MSVGTCCHSLCHSTRSPPSLMESGPSPYKRTRRRPEGSEITGAVIGVQVKGDRRFIRSSTWELPATDKDLRYWAESSVPIVGALWDPEGAVCKIGFRSDV